MTRWQNVFHRIKVSALEDAISQGTQLGFTMGVHALSHDFMLAESIGAMAGQTMRSGFAAWFDTRSEPPLNRPVIIHIASLNVPDVTSGYFVYGTHTVARNAEIFEEVPDIAWVTPEFCPDLLTAQVYGQVLLSKYARGAITGPTQALDPIARSLWIGQSSRPPLKKPFDTWHVGSIADAPDLQFLWRPVLTSEGIQFGVVTETDSCHLTDPPKIWTHHASLIETAHTLSGTHDPLIAYTPARLRAELTVTPQDGVSRHRVRSPIIQPSHPLPWDHTRRSDPSPTPDLHPPWYVSSYGLHGEAYAWQPIDAESIVVMMTRSPSPSSASPPTPTPTKRGQATGGRQSGETSSHPWAIVHWSSTDQALRNLGQIGLLAQEHPTDQPLEAARILRLPGVGPGVPKARFPKGPGVSL